MTTHQLASLLEHLQLGFGDSLKTGTGFAEAIAAIRELPDQSLKDLAKNLRKANAPQPAESRPSRPAPIDIPAVIERIRAIQNGNAQGLEGVELVCLTNPQLKDILRAFQQPLGGAKDALLTRVRQLCVPADPTNGTSSPTIPPSELDLAAVEEGVRLYTELRDNKNLTITDVRAGFERLRGYSKLVVEEICRQLKYTPHGSRTEMLDRLLSNLESIKMSQYKMNQILTGT